MSAFQTCSTGIVLGLMADAKRVCRSEADSCNIKLMGATPPGKYRYQQIIEELIRDIHSGRFKPGQKLPSEAALVQKFNTSRITVGRALRELQTKGLIERRAGSGSYVAENELPSKPLLFGLLIPDLGETEIFDPICRGLASAPEAADHGLLWGHTDTRDQTKSDQCWRLCQQFISRNVSGVFFAPLEFERAAERTNHRILAAFKEARIPVVLLDHRPSAAPEPARADVVGLNNPQAGYVATEHLIQLGCRQIGFLAYQGSETAIIGRAAGYREALRHHGLSSGHDSVMQIPEDEAPSAVSAPGQIEGFVCVNDRVAATLMQAYLSQGIRVPEDVRLVGIDDASYARLLPVPLTTVRQPCRQIGETAMRTMLERMRQPRLPAREILLDGDLVVRKSCGSI
jgi:GntR family transcriptional regulator of arabinose operon